MFNTAYVQYDKSSVALFSSIEALLSYADVLVKADNHSPISKAFKAKIELIQQAIALRSSIPTDTIWIFMYDIHQAFKRLGDGLFTNDEVDDIYSHIYRVREML